MCLVGRQTLLNQSVNLDASATQFCKLLCKRVRWLLLVRNTREACYPAGCELHDRGGYSFATGVPSTCFYVASAVENYVIPSLLLVFML